MIIIGGESVRKALPIHFNSHLSSRNKLKYDIVAFQQPPPLLSRRCILISYICLTEICQGPPQVFCLRHVVQLWFVLYKTSLLF